MSTHDICFYKELMKIIFHLSSNILGSQHESLAWGQLFEINDVVS